MTAKPVHPVDATAEQSPLTGKLESVCNGLDEVRNALRVLALDLSENDEASGAHGIARCIESRIATIASDAESAASDSIRRDRTGAHTDGR